MTKSKKIKLKNKKYIPILLFIILGLITLLCKNFIFPYYKVESRVEQQEKFVGVNNEKAISWIRVQGTNIDFPIVNYDDSDVSDPTNELGWNFSNINKLTKKVTLFSHNILNVSSNPLVGETSHTRFEQLMSFVYYDFVKENKYIQYTVDGKDYLYKIYGVSFQKESEMDHYDELSTKKEMKQYIKETKEKSYFDFDIDVDENDKLITLATCTRFFGETTEYSFVVDARLVREKEMINNYGVTEKKSYNKIKEIMEGDEENA